ncbi:hypothetical protein Isop_0007 [Isosphaera pallida ATCC 43644]|uniref:Uncharacterized protein n=1 Tax=Isosphaera pallida (strain ATCC 43644 / DSM 9630 / IS1B) TaxID=575540 RepID=E8R4L3_ISOPI|nr:hypothetical protein [Isosphaera pallida]ADV60604.1 hypothetical protein Isop_0007 [Isosphaera pallida ATCC 43644]
MAQLSEASSSDTLTSDLADQVKGLLPTSDVSGDDDPGKQLAMLELAGEEVAAGFKPQSVRALSPEVQYLHISRTIHQLVTDRNRAVGTFLFVASLLVGASSAMMNAQPTVDPIVPMSLLVRWSLPVTFGALGIIGVFMCLILIRTREGLIYEVTKMNVILGIPSPRVTRVSPLSIFYLMHLLVALLGGVCAGAAVGLILVDRGLTGLGGLAFAAVVAMIYVAAFLTLYVIRVRRVSLDPIVVKTLENAAHTASPLPSASANNSGA